MPPASDPLRTPSPAPTTEQMLLAQNQALDAQDRALDEIHDTIREVHGVGRAIGAESELSRRLIDDIADDVERWSAGVARGQETMRVVEYRSDTKALHSAICFLVLLFVVLVLFKVG